MRQNNNLGLRSNSSNIIKKEHIQAIGNFLAYYYTDLNYIKNFQDYKKRTLLLTNTEYVKKGEGTFYSFLTEYRVIRNFKQNTADRLLEETLGWVNGKNADNVDRFAEMLVKTKLTRGNKTISLASKILFLNNPWEIIPKDKRTTNAFNSKPKSYNLYKKELINFRETKENLIEECLYYVNSLAMIIENDFKRKVGNINKIRENRIIDKLLMYAGNNS